MPGRRKLLGAHRADDEDYWEHFADGMVLPKGARRTGSDDYEGLRTLPRSLQGSCWDVFKACLGCPKITRFEPFMPIGQFEEESLTKINRLRKTHGSPPVAIDDTLCELAFKIAIHYAQSCKRNSEPSSPDHMREFRMQYCTEMLLYRSGKAGLTHCEGPEAAQLLYNTGVGYNYDGRLKSSQVRFAQLLWKDTKLIGVAKITVLATSYERYKETRSFKPEERTYIVYLCYPKIKLTRNNIIRNVQEEKIVTGILRGMSGVSLKGSMTSIPVKKKGSRISIVTPDEETRGSTLTLTTTNPPPYLATELIQPRTVEKKKRRKKEVPWDTDSSQQPK